MRYLIWKENTFCTASKGYNSLVIFDIVEAKEGWDDESFESWWV